MSFDLLGPLPTGTTVLEASAGTGKTYTIAALATRYVAEGVADLSELMLVTFGRAATQELRERTRERLTQTAAGLLDPASSDDPLVQHLAGLGVEQCRRRIVRALSDFDAATIATTHSFCQRMLEGLGIAGDSDPHAAVVETVDDLVTEVVDDLFLQTFAGHQETAPVIKVKDAREAARDAVHDRQARLEPRDAEAGSAAGQRVAIASAARREVERRKRLRGIRDFDDLLVLLRDALADPAHGEAACARIRERFTVVLVDEFQDTDPVQWEVLRRAFHGHVSLILIGDPKQAIYAFRGAEVLSYLEAVHVAGTHETLPKNYRSDPGLLTALEHVYGGAALGHPKIVVHPVQAAHEGTRLNGHCPFRLRVLTREPPLGKSGFPAVAALRHRIAGDLADDVVRLLRTGDAAPGDVAVLVRTRAQSAIVRDALDRAGVPSVLAGSTSVFATAGATDWLHVLQAIEQPHRKGRVRLACLTPLLGWTAQELAEASEDAVGEIAAQLRSWSTLLTEAGFAAVFERLCSQRRLESRLLATLGGERRLTDLRHVAQALNRVAVEDGLGLTALTAWLSERVKDPASGSGDRSRRLESDAAAVQVVTVHASKGLEFPVVYLPYAWDAAKNPSITTLLLHDADGTRVRDIGGKEGPGYGQRQRVHEREEAGEELRLLYVALTRAESQVVAWWAPGASTSRSSLQRLLMGREDALEPAAVAKVPDDDVVLQRLAGWALQADGLIDIEPVGVTEGLQWSSSAPSTTALHVARFDRRLDTDWRRTSYSALTAGSHDIGPGVGSEAEEPEKTDEPDEARPVDVAAAGPLSTLNAFPGSASFGTLVHEVLEQVDTSDSGPDLATELHEQCRKAVARRLASADPDALAEALLPVMRTPLGFGTLADIAPTDRLSELDFELPLCGGDEPGEGEVTLQRVAELLRELVPTDDVLAPYADRLQNIDAGPLRGYLSGSIDAVLRTPEQYVVVDYKTNSLARGELTALHYTRAAMAEEMMRSHYVLQALLYGVALHRYLAWRQPGVPPRIRMQYLFVRGMVGPSTPAGCGVFDWTPPDGLIARLSELLVGQS